MKTEAFCVVIQINALLLRLEHIYDHILTLIMQKTKLEKIGKTKGGTPLENQKFNQKSKIPLGFSNFFEFRFFFILVTTFVRFNRV